MTSLGCAFLTGFIGIAFKETLYTSPTTGKKKLNSAGRTLLVILIASTIIQGCLLFAEKRTEFNQQVELNNQFKNELTKLDSITRNLNILDSTEQKELLISVETNKGTKNVLNDIRKADSLNLINYDKRLYHTYQEINRQYDDLYTGGSTSNDPIELANHKQILLDCLHLLEQEENNPILLSNKKVYKSWEKFKDIMEQMLSLFNPDVEPENIGMELGKYLSPQYHDDFRIIGEDWQNHGRTFRNWTIAVYNNQH